jgi:hypothetical protein
MRVLCPSRVGDEDREHGALRFDLFFLLNCQNEHNVLRLVRL